MPRSVTNNYVKRNTESYCEFLRRPVMMLGMARGGASYETKAFAIRLAAIRESVGYETKAEFARAIGVEPPAYRKWERGGAEPGIADLIRIQKITGTSLDFLVAGLVPVAVSPPIFPESARRKIHRV